MSALEREILEGLNHLSEQAKLRVLETIKTERALAPIEFEQVFSPEISLSEWLAAAEQFRDSITHNQQSAADLLNEVREERLNDLLFGV